MRTMVATDAEVHLLSSSPPLIVGLGDALPELVAESGHLCADGAVKREINVQVSGVHAQPDRCS